MAAFAATTPSLKVRPRVEPPRARGARATRVSGRDYRATRAKKSPIRVCRGGPSLGIAGVARARRRRDARDRPGTLRTLLSRLQVEFRGQTAGLKRGKAVKVRALRRASRELFRDAVRFRGNRRAP